MQNHPHRFQLTLLLALSSITANCATQTNAEFNLSDLNGSNGFVIEGVGSNDRFGRSVSSAGDINGDGIDDVIIGAYGAEPNQNAEAGSSYVVFGTNTGFAADFDLTALDGQNGFVIHGAAPGDKSGRSVSSAGDINGDHFDDLIIGAYEASPNGDNSAGSTYVVFGKATGFAATLELSSLNGSDGFVVQGEDWFDRSGISVDAAGDLNGDGTDDVIIGATGVGSTGSSYVVFGNNTGFTSPLLLSALDGSNGFKIDGVFFEENAGRSVSFAGDINHDGIDDVIIGANESQPNGNIFSGRSYVVFGRDSGFAATLELSTLDGTDGFAINGVSTGDTAGGSVSSAGDVNGDGIDDVIIGASLADPNGNSASGSSYVVFGRDSGFSAALNLSTLDGSNGFVINGVNASDRSGISVSSAGDFNGDGVGDVIVGADRGGIGSAGNSYVVFGRKTEFSAVLNLSSLKGTEGIVINGQNTGDGSGVSVSFAGDVNDDGVDDVIIGATDLNSTNGADSAYVVFGNDLIFQSGF